MAPYKETDAATEMLSEGVKPLIGTKNVALASSAIKRLTPLLSLPNTSATILPAASCFNSICLIVDAPSGLRLSAPKAYDGRSKDCDLDVGDGCDWRSSSPHALSISGGLCKLLLEQSIIAPMPLK
mmetsp:Transcript_49309/g.81868  ORF Transcript_49309/g.81868 Transcript_49309/m.81868 type:complete len:126 (-) Transcript_49309:512-889(-)